MTDIDAVNRELCELAASSCEGCQPLGLNGYCEKCWSAARNNAWNVTHPGEWTDNRCVDKLAGKIALMHSELSEALEALRAGDEGNGREEIADCLIRIFDFAGGLGWDLDAEVLKKLEKNRSRGLRHANDSGKAKRL